MNIPSYFERKGFDGIIVVKDGRFSGGMSHVSDMTKQEWKVLKKGINNFLKTIDELQELEKNKPKNAHVKAWFTLRGKCLV